MHPKDIPLVIILPLVTVSSIVCASHPLISVALALACAEGGHRNSRKSDEA